MTNILSKSYIVVVDDEKEIRDLISAYLSNEGCMVETLGSGEELLELLEARGRDLPDLLFLDRILPGMNGIQVCRKIRDNERTQHIPIIMFSGKNQTIDKVEGLTIGADDYVPKPFELEELKARAAALLRRCSDAAPKERVTVGDDLIIEKDRYFVTLKGKKVNLTYAEYKILELLASHKGRVFSRSRIIQYIWSGEKVVVERTVDFHLANLRRKIGKIGDLIKSVRGFGYVLDEAGEY